MTERDRSGEEKEVPMEEEGNVYRGEEIADAQPLT